MKKFQKQIFGAPFISFIISVALLAGCDKTYVADDPSEGAVPVIESFSPQSGLVGSEIVITGQWLNAVTKATIGGTEVTICEKVSDTRLSIKADGAASDGTIVLYNAAGSGESADIFVYRYVVPALTSVTTPSGDEVESIEMGEELWLCGSDLMCVDSVWFTSAENSEGAVFAAEILSRNEDDGIIAVKVPYVDSDDASIVLEYFDGKQTARTERGDVRITIIRRTPVFGRLSTERKASGYSVKVDGTNLGSVERILFDRTEAEIVGCTDELLEFVVPEIEGIGDDEERSMTVTAEYFAGNESYTLSEAFTVYAPNVWFWRDRRVWAQGRDVARLASFFSPETGIVYDNEQWREYVDPVCYNKGGEICSANNVIDHDKVSQAEYESVNPYFYFAGMSAGYLSVESPASTNGRLRNFYTTASGGGDASRITGAQGNWYGTPMLKFRLLDSADAADNAVIEQVLSGELDDVDARSFPISGKKLGDLSLSSLGNSVNSEVWGLGKLPSKVENLDVDIDAVIMVLYYGYDGYDSSAPGNNLRRVGFLHIRKVNFVLYNNTDAPSSSDVLFNCIWMKRDYDHSKN